MKKKAVSEVEVVPLQYTQEVRNVLSGNSSRKLITLTFAKKRYTFGRRGHHMDMYYLMRTKNGTERAHKAYELNKLDRWDSPAQRNQDDICHGDWKECGEEKSVGSSETKERLLDGGPCQLLFKPC